MTADAHTAPPVSNRSPRLVSSPSLHDIFGSVKIDEASPQSSQVIIAPENVFPPRTTPSQEFPRRNGQQRGRPVPSVMTRPAGLEDGGSSIDRMIVGGKPQVPVPAARVKPVLFVS